MPSKKSKSSKSSTSSSGTTGPPPNHPLEDRDQNHRHFLVRSMERNDVDLAALVKLNDSLHKAKQKILESCGELVLLDLGSGRLRLEDEELIEDVAAADDDNNNDSDVIKADKPSSCNRDSGDGNGDFDHYVPRDKAKDNDGEHHALSPAQKEICVDFLLRMKLRRKLCNRLVRRLNRLAHAMDGKDVQPPLPPRYGDLRLNIDSHAVAERVKEWQEKAEAKLRIEEHVRKNDSSNKNTNQGDSQGDVDRSTATKEEGSVTEEDTGVIEVEKTQESTQEDEEQNLKNNENKKADMKQEDGDGARADQPKKEKEGPAPVSSSNVMRTTEEDYDLLKEFDTAYEKTWDPKEKVFKFVLLEESSTRSGDDEPEYAQIKNGTGIGATARLQTIEDREAEHKRWQNNILNCHPQQPTFEELGLKNRVFFLEERRKRVLEEAAADGDDDDVDMGIQSSGTTPPKKSKISEVIENDSPVKRTSRKELRKKVVFETDGDDDHSDNSKNKMGTSESTTKKNEGSPQKEHQKNGFEEPEQKRPISLKPVPSFFAQDMTRINNVQRDLIENSITSHSGARIKDAINEYNRAWQESVELVNKLSQAQQSGSVTIASRRKELQELINMQTMHSQPKIQWIHEKRLYDLRRASVVLPSMQGKSQQGTQRTRAYSVIGPLQAHVALCLADIVDGCVAISEGKTLAPPFRDFVPPKGKYEEFSNAIKAKQDDLMRLENEVKQQCSQVNQQYQLSEQSRNRAWRKMLQTKSIVEAHQEMFDIRRNGWYRVTKVTASNHMHFPLPPLHQSRREPLPEEGQTAVPRRTSFATYTPPAPTSQNVSTSKYSAARVRERIAADGTVAPVSEAKRDKDGLYMRPSGRKRKGMEWDAVNGVWVPENRNG